jgi:hypothetical protein
MDINKFKSKLQEMEELIKENQRLIGKYSTEVGALRKEIKQLESIIPKDNGKHSKE